MLHEKEIKQSVLSIYPTITGLSFCYFDNPIKLVDWGNVYLRVDDIDGKVQSLINRFKPKIIVTEDVLGAGYRRTKRISLVLDHIYQRACQNELTLEKYSRAEVKSFFRGFKAETKQESAELISRWLPELDKLPPNGRYGKDSILECAFLTLCHSLSLTITETTNPHGGTQCQTPKYCPNA